jgi:hypothetical protein
MRTPTRLFLVLLPLLLATACAQTRPPPAPEPAGAPGGSGYALLYELLGQEKDVSKLLIVKRERDDFEAVIDAIAETAGRAYEDLGELGEADPSLNLTDTRLPAGERAARESISASKRNALLTENGEEFEMLMTLAQSEALAYWVGLAEGLSRAEPDPARLAFVQALWRDGRRLQDSLTALLRTRHRQPPDPLAND